MAICGEKTIVISHDSRKRNDLLRDNLGKSRDAMISTKTSYTFHSKVER